MIFSFNTKIKTYFLLIFFAYLFIGCNSTPSNVTSDYINEYNLSVFKVQYGKSYYHISLPYIKPSGISKIYNGSFFGLIVHDIIADGISIIPDDNDYALYESYYDLKTVWRGKQSRKIDMLLQLNTRSDSTYDIYLSNGLYYKYFIRNGNPSSFPLTYNVPYNTQEIQIIYSIRFPQKEENTFVETGKFSSSLQITWPEIRLPDSDGNIFPPQTYTNLGEYKIVDNQLTVNLPYIKHKYNNGAYLKRYWLNVYEFIADGRILEQEELSETELSNIDKLLLLKNERINDNKKTEIKFHFNENTLNVYLVDSSSPNKFIKYSIPYGSKEIYLTYDIIPLTNIGFINSNDRMCVHWKVQW